ncbi:TPA: hypothetical protein ACH3X1_016477 [Trebouxia sp. C0004]
MINSLLSGFGEKGYVLGRMDDIGVHTLAPNAWNPSNFTSWLTGSGSQGDAPGDNSQSQGKQPASSGVSSGLATQAGTSTEEAALDNIGSFSCNCTDNDSWNIVVPPKLVTDSGSAALRTGNNFDAGFELVPDWGMIGESSTVTYTFDPRRDAPGSILRFMTKSCFHVEEGHSERGTLCVKISNFQATLGSKHKTPRTLLLVTELGLEASYGHWNDRAEAKKAECIVGSVLVDELNPLDKVRVCSIIHEARGPIPPLEITEWNFSFHFAPKVTAQSVTAELGSVGGQQSRRTVAEYEFGRGSHFTEVVCQPGQSLALSLKRCTHAVIALGSYDQCDRMGLDCFPEHGAAVFVFKSVEKKEVLLQFSVWYYNFTDRLEGKALFLYKKPAGKLANLPRFTLGLDLSSASTG